MEEVSQRRGSIVIGCGMEEFSLSKIRRRPALEKNVSFRSIRASNLQTGLSILFHSRKMVFFSGMQGKKKTSANRLPSLLLFIHSIPFNSLIYLFAYLFIFLSDKRTGLDCNWRSFNSQWWKFITLRRTWSVSIILGDQFKSSTFLH